MKTILSGGLCRWVLCMGLVLSTALVRVSAEETIPSDEVGGSWYGMLYYGRMTNDRFLEVLRFQTNVDEAKLYSGEIGYRLHDDNLLVEFLDPVLSSVNVGLNFTYQDDPVGDIYQVNPFIMVRWSNFPWNHRLRTTFAFAEGLSYSSSVPSVEINPSRQDLTYNKLLNYLAAEVTISLPSRKNWELVYRLHHRSSIFGLMDADNDGSTAIAIGIRHYFK